MGPEKPAIPPNHPATTRSLLQWPSIQELLKFSGAEKIRDVQDPTIPEQKRCPLRVHGQGEGHGGMFNEEWGQVGVTDISGNLDWSPDKVWDYYDYTIPWSIYENTAGSDDRSKEKTVDSRDRTALANWET
ncbi:uncharacterized protein F4822DRAFT_435538 [Hypoxylon trugodes]|uniref:uncharacterized protein n=1 Tax=Hypoxylon trugodes TaxID=326681 RepID=UPI00219CF847|nr:uncharacterized protein F4822DRAFT_435538 [Hypoxylon trugodes]KAI1382487.1 hypothetical protein F4822DRAFT_435538 [Hypoxylon trugodes]